MKVHVVAKRIIDDKRGTLFRGDIVDLPDQKAEFFRRRGEVELYETKVLRDRPSLAVGNLSSALLAAPLLPQTISVKFESGDSVTLPKE
jgi:hypothetical protein